MGVDLSPLIENNLKQDIQLDNLNGKKLSIDAYNALYQFLTTIRGEDGSPLMDSLGRITSHLSGLFYRTVNFIEKGLKVVYVFDGKSPELKAKEIEERRTVREEALKMYEEAKAQGNEELMKKYATRAAFLKSYMVEDSKRLLDLMGVPWVDAPSEGEAQAAYMALRGITWGSVSQDYDSLLFGSPRLVRNLTVSGKRKLPNKDIYVEISPEMIETEKVLKFYEITREQLVDIGILVGTDFNMGIKGIGPKTALKLIKKYGKIENIKEIYDYVWDEYRKEKTIVIINDKEAIDNAVNEYGYIGVIIAVGDAKYNDMDRTFQKWVENLKGGKSDYEKERIKRGASSRLRKVSFNLHDILFIKISKNELGKLKIYNQGRNSNGSKREPKYELDLKDINSFEHYSCFELC